MSEHSPYFLAGVVLALGAGYLASLYFRSQTFKLRHIPTVGSSGIIGSYFDGLKYNEHGHEIVQEGYEKYYGTLFKVPDVGSYHVVVSGPEMIADIRRARDDQLSFDDAVAEVIQTDYTLGHEVRADRFHVPVVRTPLTRSLANRFPDIKDEIITAFGDLIPVKDTKEWASVPALRMVMQVVSRTSSRLFVGLSLCRNTEYGMLNQMFTLDVMKSARTINRFPAILKPVVGRFLTKMPENIRRTINHIGPIVQERLEQEKQFGPDWPEKPNDLISWLLDAGQGSQRSIRSIALRTLSINFAAIHTTSTAFTQILYDLATYPEYVPAMREEVEAVIETEGWTKASQGKMRKLDSFIKESHRMNIGAISISRKALKDFTFSNGTTVPVGTIMAVATRSTHFDETCYTNPDKFEGFRFAEMRDEDGEGTKHQMVALSPEYVTFGTGRHACPGRFFAVNELKTMLAHVLLTYDVKLKDRRRPENMWNQGACSPNPFAELLFRKRV